MFENIRISLKGIVSHKMRSVLTMLGVIIGITSIIVIVAIIQGTTQRLKDTMIGNDTNTVTISLYSQEDPYSPCDGSVQGVLPISKGALKAICNVGGAGEVTPFYRSMNDIKHNAAQVQAEVYGVEREYFDASDLYVVSGRLFNSSDYKNKHNAVVLSSETAGQLFKNDDAVGQTVIIGDEFFVVVGIVEKSRDYSQINTLSDYYLKIGMDLDQIYIPSTSFETTCGFDKIQSVIIKIEDLDQIVNVSNEAAGILNEGLLINNYEYKSTSLGEDSNDLDQITRIAYVLLVGIASISLLVGGIGVMNIMLVSVTERTREIGLKKALGAKRKAILSQFLTEAVVLTGMGGAIGVVLGIAISKALGLILGMTVVISLPVICLAVGFSMFVGIVFGWIPSIKASKLDPIEALRYE